MVQKTGFFFIRCSLKLEKIPQVCRSCLGRRNSRLGSRKRVSKRAEREGIIFRLGERPPADAEEEMVLSGILAGKVVQFVSRKEDNFNTSIWYRL